MMRAPTNPLAHGGWPWALLVVAGLAQAASLAWPGIDAIDWHLALGLRYGSPQPYFQFFSVVLLVKVLTWANSVKQAGLWAWLYGWVQGISTTWWLYISMTTYGQAPPIAAAIALAFLHAVLALYLAVTAAWLYRSNALTPSRAPWAFSAAWLLSEWARAEFFGGFPWGSAAVAHVDGLGFMAPVIGGLGVGALLAAGAAAIGTMPWGPQRFWTPLLSAVVAAVLIHPNARWSLVDWSETTSTGPTRVALLQGNIEQSEKFNEQTGIPDALSWYQQELSKDRRGLTIAPETAIPWLPQDVEPEYWRTLWEKLDAASHAVIFGLPLGTSEGGYFNAAWFVRPEDAKRLLSTSPSVPTMPSSQWYAKTHLVPFGEYTPPIFGWWTGVLGMPLNGFSPGSIHQPAPQWNGQRWGIQICYEDLFSDELAARMWQTHPNVWVNLSNIAWFGDTIAVPQHLNIARWRARELGRSVVRATNTGATAIINHLGEVKSSLPAFERGVLEGEVEGREGLTPYVQWAGRWGHWPWVIFAVWVMGLVGWRHRASDRAARRI